MPVMSGFSGGVPAVIVTLSNAPVPIMVVELPASAKPMYTAWAMVIVTLVPSCVQYNPSVEAYAANVFPLRVTFSQVGKLIVTLLDDAAVPPVLARLER